MISLPACDHENRTKHGKDRKGNQRWKCSRCGSTFTSNEDRPLGDMRTPLDRATLVLNMLLEGMSVRACSRITGMKPDTICDLVLEVGQRCDAFLERTVQRVICAAVELDEIWDFVGCKQRTAERRGYTDGRGDSWTWLAIDSDSKLILAHAVGLRDRATCVTFLRRVNKAVAGRVQVTSDGLRLYTFNVPLELGGRVDFAQLVKTYESSQEETRYSPARIIDVEAFIRFGNPDENRISTSYAERLNLSVRMHVRRFTRLTNAHSKSVAHHAAMVAIFVCWYNWVRKHETLGMTPAVAAGLAANRWTIQDLLRAIVKKQD